MKYQSLFRFVLALIAAIEVTSIPIRNFELGHKTVWQNIGVRSFYGPWDISIKRNGDYIDYNDYGVRIEQFRPNSYDDVSISNGYIDALPSVYDGRLSEFNTLLSSVGLADFRTGVRTGDWIDRNTDGFKERYSEDIASQKIDEDTEEPDGSVTLKL
ncbi:far upstream element-binding protein 2-like isoform x2 protein [Lasius niger]|uniref:Far upstream element-binding protein 2-like isoform x2 protein n=1 Tax=Lasius niger TaxID=67767 RepID=A0A0J7L721_LASNI|nr:far upstream element-binding protein 2-like isoform x2 protein [Lasius niger]